MSAPPGALMERVRDLPVDPGVYLFHAENGDVLYVGKAQNLRSRVRSYFRRGGDGRFERGVLNREVPRWLAEPGFRQWVVSFAPAHQRHGGEGALYVRLRRQGRRG